MNDSKIAAKLRAQLKRFLGELLPHFSKPRTAFLGDMFYGLMAGGDVKLSKICRADPFALQKLSDCVSI